MDEEVIVAEILLVLKVIYANYATLLSILITILLDVIRFSVDFIWCGKEFHILGPNTRMFFVPNLSWLIFRISEVSLYLSLGGRFVNLS